MKIYYSSKFAKEYKKLPLKIKLLPEKELTHNELFEALDKRLKNEGNTGWYGETVKLDLEARKVIER